MSVSFVPRPVQRSALRMALGRAYFQAKRWVQWHVAPVEWATTRAEPDAFAYVAASHRTPLLRRLSNVDMWLQHNKVINLGLAIRQVAGICLLPGQTFSYWRRIGRPTARRGFVPGMVLHNGQLRHEVGGGLCQLSNLLYWMSLHTPLTVVERWRHNYDVFPDAHRVLPFGSGATCAYNYVDLQLRNGTDQPFLLHLYLTDTDLVGEWRTTHELAHTYRVYESAHEICHEPWGGYTRHNELRRQVHTRDGDLVDDQFITQNHAVMMYEPLLPAQGEQVGR